MLREFFDGLTKQITTSVAPVKLPVDLGPRKTAIVVNGAIEEFETPNPPLYYQAETLADFVALIEKFGCDLVLIGQVEVTAWVNSFAKLEKIVWKREYTAAFKRLLEWQKGLDVTQRQLLTLLRNELRDAGGATALMNAAKNLRFRNSETVTARVQPGDESIGIEALNQLVGVDESFPDLLQIDTHIFLDEEDIVTREPAMLALLVEPVPADKTIRLQSREDELVGAIREARLFTQERLKAAIGTNATEIRTVVLGS